MFIAFIGVPGVGKSMLAAALAKQINAALFIEPGEECWPIAHDQPWQQQVAVLEQWVRDTNYQHFQAARQLADVGGYAVADAGIFLINRELIHAPSSEWYYSHLRAEEKHSLYETALADWDQAPCPDVLILLEADTATWRRFLELRGRSMDADDDFIRQYPEQQALIAKATERFAAERGIRLIRFRNQFGALEECAELLKYHL